MASQSVQTVSYAPSGKVWRLTYDGKILGDSRGFDTRADARKRCGIGCSPE